MNKNKFEKIKREAIGLLDSQAFRPVEGVIRYSLSESWEHFILKCKIVRALKAGVPSYYLQKWIDENKRLLFYSSNVKAWKKGTKMMKNKLKRWEKHIIFTEARFKKNLRSDIFLVSSREGMVAIEIAKSENKKSLDRKKRKYKSIGVKFSFVKL